MSWTKVPIRFCLFLALGPAAFSGERPNIVFIHSDDHAISAYGGHLGEAAPTPNIDRITSEGALFENSFCGNSIVGRSRTSILTGKLSHLNGYMDNNTFRFERSQTTFPLLLQEAGSTTALIGKWHLKSMPRGFDHWEILPGQGHSYTPDFIQMAGQHVQRPGYMTDLAKDQEEMQSVHANLTDAPILEDLSARYGSVREQGKVNAAVVPKSRLSMDWWKARFEEKQAWINDPDRPATSIVFIGDSITQGWEDAGQRVWTDFYAPRGAINLGFSGDRTEHVIWRLFNGEYAELDPEVAVVMIGTNNTGHRMQAADETAMGVERIVEILGHKWPQAKILLLGVFPRGECPDDPKRRLNEQINSRIGDLGKLKNVTYLNIGGVFLQPDGSIISNIMPDALHLSPHGYRLWAKAMAPTLADMLE